MIAIPLTAAVLGYLDQMVTAGLFGRTREDVAARLIDEGIRRKLDFSGIKVAIFAMPTAAQAGAKPVRKIGAHNIPENIPTEAPGLVAPADVRATDHAPGEPDSTTGASSSTLPTCACGRPLLTPEALASKVCLVCRRATAAAGASPALDAGTSKRGATPPPAAVKRTTCATVGCGKPLVALARRDICKQCIKREMNVKYQAKLRAAPKPVAETCGCGRPTTHPGMCSSRVAAASARALKTAPAVKEEERRRRA